MIISVQAGAGGITNPAPGSYNIQAGQIFSITALPNAGYTFKNWSGYDSWAENPTSWAVTEDITIFPVFQSSTQNKTYTAQVKAINTTTRGGAPTAANLKVQLTTIINNVKIFDNTQSYSFAAQESHIFSFSIPMPLTGTGNISAFLVDPDGNSLAQASVDIDLAPAPDPEPGTDNKKKACVYFYGNWNATIKQRIKDNPPKFLVIHYTPGCTYWDITASSNMAQKPDIQELQAAGIKVGTYISTGFLYEFKYQGKAVKNDRAWILQCIDRCADLGLDFIYADEGGVGHYQDIAWQGSAQAMAPNVAWPAKTGTRANSFKGYNMKTGFLDYAHSKGLKVCIGLDESSFNADMFEVGGVITGDFLLTDEYFWSENPGGRTPRNSEILHPERCWLLDYTVMKTSTVAAAASITNQALAAGFGAAYTCKAMATLDADYAAYMNQIRL